MLGRQAKAAKEAVRLQEEAVKAQGEAAKAARFGARLKAAKLLQASDPTMSFKQAFDKAGEPDKTCRTMHYHTKSIGSTSSSSSSSISVQSTSL